jgi:hypothetical protein
VYQLDRKPFLTEVLGHAPTQRQWHRIAEERLAHRADPAIRDSPEIRDGSSGAGTVEPG